MDFFASSISETIQVIAIILGIYVQVYDDANINRINFTSTFTLIIISVYIQYQIYKSQLFKQAVEEDEDEDDEEKEAYLLENAKGIQYLLLFIKCFISWILLWMVYISCLIIVIMMKATIINFGFVLLILAILTLHLWNESQANSKGFQYTRSAWFIMMLYCGSVLFASFVFQFGGIGVLKEVVGVFFIPDSIIDNLEIIGFEQYKDEDRYLSFLPYFVLLILSVTGLRPVTSASAQSQLGAKFFLNK